VEHTGGELPSLVMWPGCRPTPPVEARHEFARVGIDVDDIADVAVVDLLVVVIFDLHDFVAGRKGPCETLDLAFADGVQRRLQFDVERTRANAAAVVIWGRKG
jgi:hypothetical protein